jgi:hypothetical protein
MYNNGVNLPKIELISALGAVLHTATFDYRHRITVLGVDQQPVYGAIVEMADGSMGKHLRGYRTTFSISFTDKFLSDADGTDNSVLGKNSLGTFCNNLRGWDDTGGTIRLYPYRDNTDLYTDCIIPDGGFAWSPHVEGDIPQTKATDYTLTLMGKSLTSTKWS